MPVIHKFVLNLGQDLLVEADPSAEVVLVGQDPASGLPAVWIQREPEAWLRHRLQFTIVGTGHPVPPGATHVGSAICGAFVWHVYQIGRAYV